MLNSFYQQIQVIMTFLGYYDGVCDGVWGPKCIAAKRQWEFDDSFEPAVPTNGSPFTGRDRLPKGLMYMRTGLEIVCTKMTKEDKEKILAEKGNLLTTDHIEKHFSDSATEMEPQKKTVATVFADPAPAVSSHIEPKIDVAQASVAPAQNLSPVEEEEEIETVEDQKNEDSQKPNQNNHKRDWTQNRKK